MFRPDKRRFAAAFAGLFGASAVALGAWGAHAGPLYLDAAALRAWQTAVQYQAMHALGLLGLAALGAADLDNRFVQAATAAWVLGTLAFSGSLYGLALGGPRWLGPVTPLGGAALLLGWLAVAGTGLGSKAGPGPSSGSDPGGR